MRRGAVVIGIVGCLALVVPPTAGAAPPPRLGTVMCGQTGTVSFVKSLQSTTGNRPNTPTKAKFRTDPAGCTGAQSGGNPHKPGTIDHGRLVATGSTTGYRCIDVDTDGVSNVKTKITWYDAGGANLGSTRVVAGTISVSGLGNGVPNGPPPDLITFTYSGTATASSTVFPGETVSATFVADTTTDEFMVPCSIKYPPQKIGLDSLGFHGAKGPSTISVS